MEQQKYQQYSHTALNERFWLFIFNMNKEGNFEISPFQDKLSDSLQISHRSAFRTYLGTRLTQIIWHALKHSDARFYIQCQFDSACLLGCYRGHSHSRQLSRLSGLQHGRINTLRSMHLGHSTESQLQPMPAICTPHTSQTWSYSYTIYIYPCYQGNKGI